MTYTPDRTVVTAFLCDHAQVVDDKIFVLGGAWQYLWVPEPRLPLSMTVALILMIPPHLADTALKLDVLLFNEEGTPVSGDEGKPIRATGHIGGRSSAVMGGDPFVVPAAIAFSNIALDYGRYVWKIELDDALTAEVPFRVAPPQLSPRS